MSSFDFGRIAALATLRASGVHYRAADGEIGPNSRRQVDILTAQLIDRVLRLFQCIGCPQVRPSARLMPTSGRVGGSAAFITLDDAE